jgi:hypothetical protein
MRRAVISFFFSLLFLVPGFAQNLQVLFVDPQQGPICAGPLGPGPCAMVAQWIATHGQIAPLPNQFPNTMPIPPGGAAPSISNIPALNTSISTNVVTGAVQCAQMTGQTLQPDVDKFLMCTRGAVVLNQDAATLVSCAEQANGDTTNLALCAGKNVIGAQLNDSQMKAVSCVAQHARDENGFAGCIGGLVAGQLNPQQQQLLNCAANNDVQSVSFAACAGQAMFGRKLPPEANAAIGCAVQSQGDVGQFGACAANKFLNLNLNPEQQIAVQCVVASGGQPYAAAACSATRLTFRELTKCVEHGIGGDGCFGDNNDLIGRKGFVVRNIAALGGGPNSVFNNPLQVLGGPNSIANNPGQILGGPNSVPNVILRNIPSPPPVTLGTVGGHRVCVPWC